MYAVPGINDCFVDYKMYVVLHINVCYAGY